MKKIKKNEVEEIFTKLTQKFGISLITLVITIIVIIILTAAVVISLNNNNVLINASKARYESDRDYVQSVLELVVQKVVLRHQGAIDLEVGPISTAAMNVKTTAGEIIWESVEVAGLNGKIIFGEGIDTDTEFYTGEELPVYGSETTWYVDEHGKVVLQTAGKIYGAEDVPKAKEYISKTESYVGYYADIDGDGTVDGVIYADLAMGNTGDGEYGSNGYGTYTIPQIADTKKYYIVEKAYSDDFGTKDVITGKGYGKERFYIMALDDISTDRYCWYYEAYGNMSSRQTSVDFGKGKQNTENMIGYWNEKKYGEQNASDMWGNIHGKVAKGWYVPSRAEWSAFLEELGITSTNYYGSFRLSEMYLTSSQCNTDSAWYALVNGNYIGISNVKATHYIRLGATF